jgi:hypothetical protein
MKLAGGSRPSMAFLLLALVLAGSALARDTIEVLWCGNSYTHPTVPWIDLMINCDTCGADVPVYMQKTEDMIPSANLQVYWDDGFATDQISSGSYDWVLLQDMQGNVNWDGGRDQMFEYTSMFADLIRGRGGDAITFYNWVWEGGSQSNLDYFVTFFDSLCATYGTLPMPVGIAWWLAQQERPGYEYYDPNWGDGNHPGWQGAYVTGCVAFATLTGISPVGNKWRNVYFDWANHYVAPDDALFFQEKAWEAYSLYVVTKARLEERGRSLKNMRLVTGPCPPEAASVFDLRGRVLPHVGYVRPAVPAQSLVIIKEDRAYKILQR